MDGLFRRGGIWYARLAIPRLLRGPLGKSEFIASTRQADRSVAKAIASTWLAGWRLKLLALSDTQSCHLDTEKLFAGHPALASGGYTTLERAVEITTIDKDQLFRHAEQGQLRLHVRLNNCPGYLLPDSAIEREHDGTGEHLIVPSEAQMPIEAVFVDYLGVAEVQDSTFFAKALLSEDPGDTVLLRVHDKAKHWFVPNNPVLITPEVLEFRTSELESLRLTYASKITPELLELARRPPPAPVHTVASNPKLLRPVSEAVIAYMKVRSLDCNDDQTRRVQAALDLFIELEGNPSLGEIDSDRLEKYRDEKLPAVPANENKVRLKYGSTSVKESILKVAGTDWPGLSLREQVKRTEWLAGMFTWLHEKNWIDKNPAGVLVKESSARAKSKKETAESDEDAREIFEHEDLQAIFSHGNWFRTGRGNLTAKGTYREFMPLYYWLPLLGLHTGARINELAQLHLSDIRQSPEGTWFYNIATLDDESKKKKRKNQNSKRRVPVHPILIEAGFIKWKTSLESAGYQRLFPELKHDRIKGYGKAATRWFGRYLSGLGWPRDGKKVFHSFRGTLTTHCVNRMKLTAHETAQISGHTRGAGALVKHYLNDELPSHLLDAVSRVDFQLPPIAPFDCEAGLKALEDALKRKDQGRGANEDV